MDPADRTKGMTRKELFGTGAAAAAVLAQGKGSRVHRALAAGGKDGNVAGMNMILFLTDQERAIQHFKQEVTGSRPSTAHFTNLALSPEIGAETTSSSGRRPRLTADC